MEKKPELVTNYIKKGGNFLKMLNFPIFFSIKIKKLFVFFLCRLYCFTNTGRGWGVRVPSFPVSDWRFFDAFFH